MKAYLLPFADIISYCLMPTHFHWQIYVYRISIQRKLLKSHIESIEKLRRKLKYGQLTFPDHPSTLQKSNEATHISINESIGILQRTYTRAVNKEKNWSGSLFRSDCKAKDGWIDEFITLTKSNGKPDYRFTAGSNYAYSCFEYLNNNPKQAGLVNENTEWQYSSAREYAGIVKDNICNLELGRKLLGI